MSCTCRAATQVIQAGVTLERLGMHAPAWPAQQGIAQQQLLTLIVEGEATAHPNTSVFLISRVLTGALCRW
jgi:hypothetical protein